ncbi:hypothetical protein ACS0TY_003799 [Phlomoides rotata]
MDWPSQELFAPWGFEPETFGTYRNLVFRPTPPGQPLGVKNTQRLVIKTNFLSLFEFLCGASWFVYGLLGKDPFFVVSRI